MIKFYTFIVIFAFFVLGCDENKLEIECVENENIDMNLEDSDIKKNKGIQELIEEYQHIEDLNEDVEDIRTLKPIQFEGGMQVENQDFGFYTE